MSPPPGPSTVNVTEYKPSEEYKCCGEGTMAYSPSPKSHLQNVSSPEQLAINFTLSGIVLQLRWPGSQLSAGQ
jgi:hypothetical protein